MLEKPPTTPAAASPHAGATTPAAGANGAVATLEPPGASNGAGRPQYTHGTEVRSSAPPTLAPGCELLGEYAGSGFKEPHFLARRADGQMVQLTRLLHLVVSEIDGQRDSKAIAANVSEHFGRRVSARNVDQLVEGKLRPLGVVAGADGSAPQLKRNDPMLALRFRTGVIPPAAVRAITVALRPFFFLFVVVAVAAAVVIVDVEVFAVHGVAQAFRQMLYQPMLMLLVLGVIIVSAAFHECGHATGCRFGGARPGTMGAGIYMVWPAFYTDVTDAYRLGRGGRLRTDLGGVYFNLIVILATFGLYLLTGFEPLLAIILLQHIEIVHQLLPFLRLDGYYIVADITGVPDMFARIKPTLLSLIPGRRTDPRVSELKTWVRGAVTLWVLLTVPILLYVYGELVVNFPRLIATAADSFHTLSGDLVTRAHAGQYGVVLVDVLQMITLALPTLGLVITLWRLVSRVGRAAIRRTEGRPAARAGLVVVGAAALAFLAVSLIPRGHYTQIGPQERGTVQAGVASLSQPIIGRPLFAARALSLPDPHSSSSGPSQPANAAPQNGGAAPGGQPQQQQQSTTTSTGIGVGTGTGTGVNGVGSGSATVGAGGGTAAPPSASAGASVTVSTSSTSSH